MNEHEEKQARRRDALRRLGAKIVWLTCASCRLDFLDMEQLGGRVWRVKVASGARSDGYRYPSQQGVYCSQDCAYGALLKVGNAQAAWVEGFEP